MSWSKWRRSIVSTMILSFRRCACADLATELQSYQQRMRLAAQKPPSQSHLQTWRNISHIERVEKGGLKNKDSRKMSTQQEDFKLQEERMPAIYLGHGAPPLLDDAQWTRQLSEWSAAMPRPKEILIVSAHWEEAPLALSATRAATPLVYDFWGFESRFYSMTYPSPDASALAKKITASIPKSRSIYQHPSRGLDHGSWVPLKVLYPDASIPVLQLSLPTLDPEELLKIGALLRPLRDEGVLIIGSGFMTHGLPYLRDFSSNAAAPGWSADFDSWAKEALGRGDLDELMNFERAPGMPYAHPTAEHFAPLFVVLGAAQDPGTRPDTVIDGFWWGLAKRSFQVA